MWRLESRIKKALMLMLVSGDVFRQSTAVCLGHSVFSVFPCFYLYTNYSPVLELDLILHLMLRMLVERDNYCWIFLVFFVTPLIKA